jgi:mannobiose 2-epimerase
MARGDRQRDGRREPRIAARLQHLQDKPLGKPESRLKEWWVQMEGLNSLLLMHEKYGLQTDVYFKAFQRQWQFIRAYQIDGEFHGVYEMVGSDGNPVNPHKGRIWKAAYHDGRALLNVSERLRHLASAGVQ